MDAGGEKGVEEVTEKTHGTVTSAWYETLYNIKSDTIINAFLFEEIEDDEILSFQVDPNEKDKWMRGEINKIAVIRTVKRLLKG